MPEPSSQHTRRPRPALPNDCQSGSDGDDLIVGGRPGPAARKRELERQRRNLVSTRFLELDSVLSQSADVDLKTGVQQQSARRIDKEAILKDAASRITTQSSELSQAHQRLSFMTKEVENLRAEKVELRADKSYLHSELTAIRSEVLRLRSDNIHLWQAIRGSGGLKSVLNPDLAKIPADILLRAHCTAAATANLDATPESAGPGKQPADANPGRRDDLQEQFPSLAPSQQGKSCQGDQAAQKRVPPRANSMPSAKRRRSSFESSTPDAVQSVHDPAVGCDAQQAPLADTAVARGDAEAGSLVDSFLIFQSPEDLGELFADIPNQPGRPNSVGRPRPSVARSFGQADDGQAPVSSVPQPSEEGPPGDPAAVLAFANRPPDLQIQPRPVQSFRPQSLDADGSGSKKDPEKTNDDAQMSEDFLADIAYCA